MNWNPFDGNQESLPLMMVQQYGQGPSGFDRVGALPFRWSSRCHRLRRCSGRLDRFRAQEELYRRA